MVKTGWLISRQNRAEEACKMCQLSLTVFLLHCLFYVEPSCYFGLTSHNVSPVPLRLLIMVCIIGRTWHNLECEVKTLYCVSSCSCCLCFGPVVQTFLLYNVQNNREMGTVTQAIQHDGPTAQWFILCLHHRSQVCSQSWKNTYDRRRYASLQSMNRVYTVSCSTEIRHGLIKSSSPSTGGQCFSQEPGCAMFYFATETAMCRWLLTTYPYGLYCFELVDLGIVFSIISQNMNVWINVVNNTLHD